MSTYINTTPTPTPPINSRDREEATNCLLVYVASGSRVILPWSSFIYGHTRMDVLSLIWPDIEVTVKTSEENLISTMLYNIQSFSLLEIRNDDEQGFRVQAVRVVDDGEGGQEKIPF